MTLDAAWGEEIEQLAGNSGSGFSHDSATPSPDLCGGNLSLRPESGPDRASKQQILREITLDLGLVKADTQTHIHKALKIYNR